MAQKSCQFALSPSISAKLHIGLRRFMVKAICVEIQLKSSRSHYAQASTLAEVGFSTSKQPILILQQNLQDYRLKQTAFKTDLCNERSQGFWITRSGLKKWQLSRGFKQRRVSVQLSALILAACPMTL